MADRAIPNAGALKGRRKSSRSNYQDGSCLEVLDNCPTGVPVRDSKAPEGPALVFPSAGWASFVAGVKNGHLFI
ncbi:MULTISPECIES: DUF397 domain-containing protein [unclassified Streptomyces]|uniref:DUF397 domain-containing protein n=1 Tax=unclassified Streptomyces TaxID=2593676 RepID=UPI0005AB0CB9|nr:MULTISPECIES: DUF397 domain-containing protein [unclassified Streptomyces]ODA74961.1 hypothetical protein APS67_000669 [Streptomyces sp. AVP053U2]